MSARHWVLLAGLGVAGYLAYRWLRSTPVVSGGGAQTRMPLLTQAIDTGTYNAAMLRNQAFNNSLTAAGGTAGFV